MAANVKYHGGNIPVLCPTRAAPVGEPISMMIELAEEFLKTIFITQD